VLTETGSTIDRDWFESGDEPAKRGAIGATAGCPAGSRLMATAIFFSGAITGTQPVSTTENAAVQLRPEFLGNPVDRREHWLDGVAGDKR
jgi:hypothetical protein